MNDLFFIMEAVSCERIKLDLDAKRTRVWFYLPLAVTSYDSGCITLEHAASGSLFVR